MNLKKAAAAIAASAIMFAAIPAMPVKAAEVSVSVDGYEMETEVITESGISMVPITFFEDAVGAMTSYNARQKKVNIETAATSVSMTVDKEAYKVNNAGKEFDVAPMVEDGVVYVQMDAVFADLGARINVDIVEGSIAVNYFSGMTGSVKLTGSTTVQPIAQRAADYLNEMNDRLSVSVAGGGSGTGINDTAAGTNNVGMSSSELTAEQKAGVKYVIPVALDAIAIIVHPDNEVDNLTREQAIKIFTGEIKNWNEVGGADEAIVVQTRETGSGTLVTLQDLLLGKGVNVVDTATPHASATLLKQAVASEENAIGFDSVGFVDETVKALTLDGIAANRETVESGTYQLGRSLYLLSKGRPAGSSAKFIDFFRSRECQDKFVIEENFLSIRSN